MRFRPRARYHDGGLRYEMTHYRLQRSAPDCSKQALLWRKWTKSTRRCSLQPFFKWTSLFFFFFKGSRIWISHFFRQWELFPASQWTPDCSFFCWLHFSEFACLFVTSQRPLAPPPAFPAPYLYPAVEVYNKASILIPRMNPHSVLQLWDRLQSHRLFLVSWPPLRKALLLMLVLTLCTKD